MFYKTIKSQDFETAKISQVYLYNAKGLDPVWLTKINCVSSIFTVLFFFPSPVCV
jgi:hypothetical protein